MPISAAAKAFGVRIVIKKKVIIKYFISCLSDFSYIYGCFVVVAEAGEVVAAQCEFEEEVFIGCVFH